MSAGEHSAAPRSPQTAAMNMQAVQAAFDAAYTKDPRDGLTITHTTEDGKLCIEVRHVNVEGDVHGFDVVAQPTEAEGKTAEEVGRDMAEVVERELAYAQLPAQDENGDFRRIVV
ncbi:hypothetical protein E5E91_02075 [Deinococcus radiodurans R1 = ATCC 13939 = DSM 20539]|uniref:Uncharacterized protein n=2 Tax=Deinococcus radiodurans TaxID=1299 RepID=Q9RXB1_DEIRA|nr:hypothetical protein DR_0404 [Deinococcus radiodurans R1 = ATCC 13939 = DSM 20539]QEM72356.1 hypothetical protein DXG80_11670 [Deinococcus radiodurans]UDK99590.1 hypothetical protein E5E91_02075 [Deinococcus radiodurans R1 = ATCC 13939 = DSM 20539]